MNVVLPPCATTGVGSLPYLAAAPALALSLDQEVPFLPELPRFDPDEFMIPAALCGFDSGVPDLHVLRRFLEVLPAPRVIKVQMVGPTTLIAWGEFGEPARVLDWLHRRARDTLQAVRVAGHDALFVIDEPGLVTSPPIGLPGLVQVLRQEGARVGLHCCGNTDWGAVLDLGLDYVSLDARLSLDALLEQGPRWRRFVEGGGALILGIIPTSPGATCEVGELCDSVEASLRATTPDFEVLLARSLVSPACGLGLHSVAEAERITAEVRQAQALLRALL